MYQTSDVMTSRLEKWLSSALCVCVCWPEGWPKGQKKVGVNPPTVCKKTIMSQHKLHHPTSSCLSIDLGLHYITAEGSTRCRSLKSTLHHTESSLTFLPLFNTLKQYELSTTKLSEALTDNVISPVQFSYELHVTDSKTGWFLGECEANQNESRIN